MIPRITLLLLVVCLLSVGCRRRSKANGIPETPAPAEAPVAESTPPPRPISITPPALPGAEAIADKLPTAAPNASKTSPVDRSLTEALHRFFEANNRMPTDFSELVRAKFIPAMPNPPAGKRFAIDRANMQVVLVGQ